MSTGALVYNLPGSSLATDNNVQTWGIPWTPEEFTAQVVKAGHPMDMEAFLPKQLQQLLSDYGRCDVAKRVSRRLDESKFWLKKALELKKDEADLHSQMNPSVAAVLKGKRILLWKNMLEYIDYEDMGVVTEMTEGAKLVGESDLTGLWPKKFKPASMTVEDLASVSTAQRSSLTFASFGFMEEDILEAVWSQTLDEVAAGELSGPFDVDAVPAEYPLSKRFGIRQSAKVRCVTTSHSQL